MAIVCSGCDVEPAADATAGATCASCGERLISFETKDDLVGSVLDGRFEVLAPLGHGGMGVVYRAKQLSIGREVALKVLDRRIERDVASVKRFFREAKLASTLAHPNTVPIIDFGQSGDGRLFLVMELVVGRTLAEELEQVGPLSLDRVIAIGTQLCEALEVAHELAIVHRDLKLENVMLLAGKRDHIKVLDFGLARSLTDPTTQMTATGLISGTPRYMPPEVALDAAPPQPSQDMYAVGVILAELVIGRALWVAPTIEALFTKKLSTEQSLADVPAVLKPLLRSLLDAEPTARPTAADTRQKLRELDVRSPLQLELDPPAVSPPPKHQERARSPVALDPTADITQVPDPLANLELVSLDERGGAPPVPVPVARVAPVAPHDGPPGTLPHDTRFDAPPEGGPLELEIDRAYVVERSRTLKARAAEPVVVVKKPSSAGWVFAVLLLAAAGAGGYWYYENRYERPEERLPGGGVSIRITADGEHAITIDGKPAGTTPLSLKLPKGQRPILIEGTDVVPQQLIPDHDQTVHLATP
jgi:serine/threonine-protein kinase